MTDDASPSTAARPGARQIDREQVCLMTRTGFRAALIGERLGCSARQVRRIAKEEGARGVPNDVLGSDDEHLLWAGYHAWGESFRRIGYRFGVSHEHVRQTLTS